VNLTTLVGLINLWNRIAIGLRSQPAVDTGKTASCKAEAPNSCASVGNGASVDGLPGAS
jgi:hypothetical protein